MTTLRPLAFSILWLALGLFPGAAAAQFGILPLDSDYNSAFFTPQNAQQLVQATLHREELRRNGKVERIHRNTYRFDGRGRVIFASDSVIFSDGEVLYGSNFEWRYAADGCPQRWHGGQPDTLWSAHCSHGQPDSVTIRSTAHRNSPVYSLWTFRWDGPHLMESQVYILDEDLRPVRIGAGILFVRSPSGQLKRISTTDYLMEMTWIDRGLVWNSQIEGYRPHGVIRTNPQGFPEAETVYQRFGGRKDKIVARTRYHYIYRTED